MNQITNFPTIQEMEMLMKYCEILSKSPAYQSFGGLPGVFAVVMTARELGIGAMTALNGGLWPIATKGAPPKIVQSAHVMNMMVLRAGHKIEELHLDDEKCVLRGTRKDTGANMTVTYTFKQAADAGLTHHKYDTQYNKKGSPKLDSAWWTNRQDMLWKSALSRLARRLFADVIGNCYTEAEVEQFKEEEQKPYEAVTVAEPQMIKNKRGRRPNVETVDTAIDSTPSNEDSTPSEIDKFIEEYDIKNPQSDIHIYLSDIADLTNKTFDEMVQEAFEQKDNFLKSYEDYCYSKSQDSIALG